ncbi:TSC22 domain family protein 1 isoform X2 [Xenopus laevis]|uniref:TSC22 domain family protein 1 isoform X2 n=2 Tax=Xenopus laevis TaxID=8355 RepID=A0A8J1MEZ8_XENLA|nr:TSC22 domain family protein 1 isoform X2 [Xenopus laevis]
MHQPDPAADLAARKMAHPADLPRRGSGNSAALNAVAGPGVAGHVVPSDDYPPLLVQPPAAASSPGPQQQQHPPPQTLNLLPQCGAQMKKKSGFQITSVTSAQISANMSSNNSIAEDTESYDDLDESHTEDLSSSEILDVSLSRATDLGGPERSSSEETLNNFQEAETPGAVSPNQPHLPQHHLPQNVQQNIMINGGIHHHHPYHHGHNHPPQHGLPNAALPGGLPPTPAPVKAPPTGSSDSAVTAVPVAAPSISHQPAGSIPPTVRKASGPVSTGIAPVSGNASAPNNANISSLSGVTGSLPSGVNITPSSVTSNVGTLPGSLNLQSQGTTGNGSSASSAIMNNVSGAAAAVGQNAVQHQTVPSGAATSRFRVVKLDSSLEPFKKGRWTCMEFYDKDNAAAASNGAVVNKAVESVKQNPLEVMSERESTSGSSVSSNISTLSHYTESVGSGEMGTPSIQQPGFQGLGPQQMDMSNAIAQTIPAPSMPQSISQPQLAQLQMHSQDANFSPQKLAGQLAQAPLNASAGVQPASVNILGVPSSLGHQQPSVPTLIPQQLPYTQQTQPMQSLPAVPQQLQYTHQQTSAAQMTSGHVPVNQSSVPGNLQEYIQHSQIIQTAVPPMQTSSTGVVNTAAVPVAQAHVLQAQSSTAQAPATVAQTQPVAHIPAPIAATGQMLGVNPQGNLPTAVHQAAAPQLATSIIQQSVPAPSSQVLPPPQGIQVGPPGITQQVIIAPQSTLLPAKPQSQLIDPPVQGMSNQQGPAVSPLLAAAASVPTVQQLSTSITSALSPAASTLGPPPTVSQASAVQNCSLSQSSNQAPVMANVPVAQSVPLQMTHRSGLFFAPSLIQSVASQIEDARRIMEHSVVGLSSVGEGASVEGGGGLPVSGSLLPLKSLPLSTPLVDGEDERCIGVACSFIYTK